VSVTAVAPAWTSIAQRRATPAATAAATPFHPLIRGALYLFVASLPFEYPGRSIPLEVTTITGCVFLLTTLIQPVRCFGRTPAALWCFAAFLYFFWVSFAIGGGAYPNEALKSFTAFLLLMLVFWAASNLLRDVRVSAGALLTLGIASAVLALLTVGGAVRLDPDWVKDSGRVTLLGQNANRAGLILGSGALALVGLAYAREHPLFRPRFFVWPMLAVIGLAMLQGASRGSLLALVVGLWTFTVGGRTIVANLRNAVIALCAVGLLAWAGWQLPLTRARFHRVEQLDLSGREEILPAAVGMVLERPLSGWGPSQNKYELGYRLPQQAHERRDTHNLVLEVLTSTGLLGGVPFLLGVGLCIWGAWKSRRGADGILPFAMAAAVLTANMSSNYIAFKLFWLVLAYGSAAGSRIAGRPDSPPSPTRVRGPRSC